MMMNLVTMEGDDRGLGDVNEDVLVLDVIQVVQDIVNSRLDSTSRTPIYVEVCFFIVRVNPGLFSIQGERYDSL